MKYNLRYVLVFIIIFLLHQNNATAQKENAPVLFRVYEDNDFLNIRGKGTDKAYSGGTRFDYFYYTKRNSLLSPGRLFRRSINTIDIASWGIMQTIFTPNNIKDPFFQPKDYFYSGALFIDHCLYHYNSLRHYSIQSEYLLGVRGPAAFAGQTQAFIHRCINYTVPQGWNNQLQNAPIINANITVEKQLAHYKRSIELLAGAKGYAGTFQNALSIYYLLRIGIMTAYFDGYINQFSGTYQTSHKEKKKIQAYVVVKPQFQFVLSNALVTGGVFAKKPNLKVDMVSREPSEVAMNQSNKILRHYVYSVDFAVVVSIGRFALSFNQNTSSELRKNTYNHEVGNISMYFIF